MRFFAAMTTSRKRSALGAAAIATSLLAASLLAAACSPGTPREPKPTGEPVPSASTSAEPLWIRNKP